MVSEGNAKEELINTIALLAQNKGIEDIKYDLYLILNDYDVQKVTTELTIYQGDVNEQLLKKYIMSKTIQGCTQRTIGYYKNTLQNFANFISKPLTEVTSDEVRYYLATRRVRDKVSKTTAGNEWRNLSAFYAWLTKEELVAKNIMLKVESIKKEKKKKKAFTEEDIEKIRDGCKNDRDRCLIEVMLSTWCRVTEVSNMKISDIKEDGSMIVFGKGEKERTVYLNAKAKYQVEKYLNSRTDDEDWLFVSLDKPHSKLQISAIEIATRNIGKRVKVSNCHPHRFRRTGATFALRAGMKVEDVSRILGHESLETTQIYLDIDDKAVHLNHEKYSR